MSSLRGQPGPGANQAFRLGIATATVLALTGLATLYSMGSMTRSALALAILLGLPVYLLFVASALSVWLGFDKDVTDLRPVHEKQSDDPHR